MNSRKPFSFLTKVPVIFREAETWFLFGHGAFFFQRKRVTLDLCVSQMVMHMVIDFSQSSFIAKLTVAFLRSRNLLLLTFRTFFCKESLDMSAAP